jgi:polyhydroxyalkanoate synthesis regulator phasin
MLQATMGEERPMAKMQDVRKTIEASLGNLSTTRAQEIAKSMLDKDAAKDQVSKTAADLMEWSQRNRTRLVDLIRGEVRDQLRQMGVATEDEVNALRKRVRELERASRATGARSGKKTTGAKAPAKAKTASRKPAAAKTTTPTKTDTTGA